MNGYESDEADEMEALIAEADEAEPEATNPRYRRPQVSRGISPRTMYRGPTTQSTNFVTQTQLTLALTEINNQLKTNSKAIETLSNRIATVNRDEARVNAALKKEADQRKKDTANITNNVQMAMLLPLLLQPKPKKTTQDIFGDNDGSPQLQIEKGTNLAIASDNTLALILPFLLLGGGFGGMSAGTGTSGGMDQNCMMMLVLAIALGGLGGK